VSIRNGWRSHVRTGPESPVVARPAALRTTAACTAAGRQSRRSERSRIRRPRGGGAPRQQRSAARSRGHTPERLDPDGMPVRYSADQRLSRATRVCFTFADLLAAQFGSPSRTRMMQALDRERDCDQP
jgi:hypothetical protein